MKYSADDINTELHTELHKAYRLAHHLKDYNCIPNLYPN